MHFYVPIAENVQNMKSVKMHTPVVIFVSQRLYIFNPLYPNSCDPDEMLHFTRVCTVCQDNHNLQGHKYVVFRKFGLRKIWTIPYLLYQYFSENTSVGKEFYKMKPQELKEKAA